LAQLEEFQKRLWLKKKFVVDTNYCITLDKIDEKFYTIVAENEAQWAEWETLFAISEIETDLFNKSGNDRLSILKAQPHLVLDTAFFSADFKNELIATFDNLDEELDGLLIHSENFQALNLLQNRYHEQVKCIYIDPPYNTGNDGFVYKDNFQRSSWLSMIYDRFILSRSIMKDEASLAVSIDIKELDKVIIVLDSILGEENRRSNITIKRGSLTGAKVINPGVVNISENVVVYSNQFNNWKPERAFKEKGYDKRYNLYIQDFDKGYENWSFITVLEALAKKHNTPKNRLKKAFKEDYNKELYEFVVKNARRIVQFASLDENSISKEAVELKKKSQKSVDKIFYLPREGKNDYYVKKGKLLLFYKDRLIKIGNRIVPGEPISDIWNDVLPNDLHNEGNVALRKGKKPEKLVHRIIESSTINNELIFDFFLGSGTTTAVAQKSGRKWIGVEGGSYFRDITLKRMKHTLNGETSGISSILDWKGGGFFKYIRLESYEDVLNNLQLKSVTESLDLRADFKEDYTLNYWLDVETRDSLLTVQSFRKPFDYTLQITQDNEMRPTKIDLVETFNYLIGLQVKTSYRVSDIHIVIGDTISGEHSLVIWRDMDKTDNAALNKFFVKMKFSTLDTEFDRIYVNGDNNLENLKTETDKWKVELIESVFFREM
jgi:adenine-specific DNA-methyltransferase